MKKVLLKFFGANNLGDDLFAYIILNRYENDFFTYYSAYKPISNFDNIHFKSNFFKKTINKIFRECFNIHDFFEVKEKKKYDLLVYVGGSLFIESPKKNYWIGKAKTYKENYIPYYILGSNFGPYKTEGFLPLVRDNIFLNATDICFREKYSYDLFKNLENVRYASDIVFTLDTSKLNINNSKKVIISVIDCTKKTKVEFKENYENRIVDFVKLFDKKGYEITLMSYCEREGDEEAIKSIIQKVGNMDMKLKDKINIYNYKDNIIEALNVMADSQIIVGSRFHANILGLVLQKTIIPIAYSDKTINVLKDMNFKGKIFDIRDMDSFDVNILTDEDLLYKFDTSSLKLSAEEQFKKLDEILIKR